ncbi:aldo/keto reductase [Devosia sp. XK-2]|uniref:aldo/keto reductase n=1 Tax=Devosia sp. XK-2 TaxID=3126689 RepID=UPI0030CDA941
MPETITLWDGRSIPRLGMGCWPIGGKQMGGGISFAYAGVEDGQSLRALEVADEMGAKLYDTASAYGFGHSEKLLGQVFGERDDIVVVTKFGFRGDYETREGLPVDLSAAGIAQSIEESRRNLRRDRLDMVLLHIGDLPLDEARVAFDTLDILMQQGRLASYGWCTDDLSRIGGVVDRPGFESVEIGLNLFQPNAELVRRTAEMGLTALIRSPLAMGLLGGHYQDGQRTAPGDVRRENLDWVPFFADGKAHPDYAARLAAVRDLLCVEGRSIAQGALGWVLAQGNHILPIPGFKTEAQVRDNLGALEKGLLPPAVMAEIEAVLDAEAESA